MSEPPHTLTAILYVLVAGFQLSLSGVVGNQPLYVLPYVSEKEEGDQGLCIRCAPTAYHFVLLLPFTTKEPTMRALCLMLLAAAVLLDSISSFVITPFTRSVLPLRTMQRLCTTSEAVSSTKPFLLKHPPTYRTASPFPFRTISPARTHLAMAEKDDRDVRDGKADGWWADNDPKRPLRAKNYIIFLTAVLITKLLADRFPYFFVYGQHLLDYYFGPAGGE